MTTTYINLRGLRGYFPIRLHACAHARTRRSTYFPYRSGLEITAITGLTPQAVEASQSPKSISTHLVSQAYCENVFEEVEHHHTCCRVSVNEAKLPEHTQHQHPSIQSINAAGGLAVRERVSKRVTLEASIRVGRGSTLTYLLRVGRYYAGSVYSHDRQRPIIRSEPFSPTSNTRVSVSNCGCGCTPIGRTVCARWPTPRTYLLDTHRYYPCYLPNVGQRSALGRW